MAKFEIKGEVKVLMPSQAIGEHVKQTLVIHEKETSKVGAVYENDVAVEFWNDRADKIKELKTGDLVTVTASVRGREWESKWFNNVNGIFVDVIGKAKQERVKNNDVEVEGTGDLPF